MFLEPRPSTLPEILDLSVRLYPRRLALVMRQGLRDDRWTYARLHKTSCAWASFLQSRGLRAGDRLLLQSSSSPSLIAAMFGAFRAGVVLVPLDAQCTASFIARVAVDTHARGLLGPAHAQPPPGLPLIPLGPVADSGHRGIAPPVQPNDLAEIMFTSGTTAQPKGVMLTHGNIVSNVWSAGVLPHGPDHRLLSVLPISHMLEQTGGIFLPLSSGASIAFTTSMRSSALLFAFAERRPTTLVAVPRLLDLLLQGIVRDIETRGRLSHWRAAHQLAPQLPMVLRRFMFYPVHRALGGSLRWIFSGGAALDPGLQAAWRQLGITLMQGYGATECAPLVSCQRATDTSIGSVGRALPGITVKLRDDSELMVRGPNVTSGYWQDAQATSEVVHDGWYATGDLARIDDNGEIRLLGRKREMITLPSGLNVFPADIDAELQREAALVDAATVSWSSDGSAAVYAVVIPRPDVDPAQVGRAIRSANARLAAHQQITGWSIWPEPQLPLTPTRKVRRGEIVAWLQRPDQTKPDTLDETDSRSPSLLRLLALTTHRQLADILPTSMLTSDLGLDSLARVELAVAIEQQFGVAVSDEAMGQADTVADLEQLIASSPGEVLAKEFPSWPFSALATRARTVLQRTLIFPLLRLICRPLVIVGEENLSQVRSPVLIVANHGSHLDAPLLLSALPPRIRRTVAVAAAKDYFFASADRALPAQVLLGAFPLARTGPILPSLEQCGRLVDRGRSILIFPEGTRSIDGSVGPFKAGIGLLARELRIPVVPIGIHGARDRLPKGRTMPVPGSVRLSIGPPVLKDTDATDQIFADRLREQVIALLD